MLVMRLRVKVSGRTTVRLTALMSSAHPRSAGEGAQAYGRGLYFAEREKTAEGYRKKLSRDNLAQRAKDNQSYDTLVGLGLDESPDLGTFSIILSEADGDMARAIQDSMTPRYPDDPLPAFAQSMADAMKSGRLPASIELPTLNKGSMYEVNIAATPDEFIDWDLPLDEQSESVMNALNKTDWYQYAEEGAYNAAERRGDNAYGMDLVRWLEEDGAEDAAQMLKDAGIKGVQYADAQTRFGKGPKTKNYVVYDDKLIDIIQKVRHQHTRSSSGPRRHHDTGRSPGCRIRLCCKKIFVRQDG
jgi:hypothetical protein